eukprot:CAMPEP_0170568270 /NCGR_PEP_ID=MMETSP0211-20121228/81064_1 /TAXON_ID=311385 /ORGANISM="Pseudokeronopsis sp., Strain OXSARD2" /LENGTH=42 /DNA_ID= /DNA_START= /DNA_END= /DNA_ORIENTATION=
MAELVNNHVDDTIILIDGMTEKNKHLMGNLIEELDQNPPIIR